jgi:hypothetical protein
MRIDPSDGSRISKTDGANENMRSRQLMKRYAN